MSNDNAGGLTREEMMKKIEGMQSGIKQRQAEIAEERMPDTSKYTEAMEKRGVDAVKADIERGVVSVNYWVILLFTDGNFRLVRAENKRGRIPTPTEIMTERYTDGTMKGMIKDNILDVYGRNSVVAPLGIFTIEEDARKELARVNAATFEAKKAELDYMAEKLGQVIARNLQAHDVSENLKPPVGKK